MENYIKIYNYTRFAIFTANILAGLVLFYCQMCRGKRAWFIRDIQLIPAHSHLIASMDSLIRAPKFLNWIAKLDKTLSVKSITITDINWFSAKPDSNKLGFVKCTVDAIEIVSGKKVVSNIVFVRGDSVAVLIMVNVEVRVGRKTVIQEYVLLCEQMRLPSGGRLWEICAGMMDAEGGIASVALKEVEEETGFVIKHKRDLIELGSIYPSPGACDEEIHLYAWTTTISEPDFLMKQMKLFGNAMEGEEIKLLFMPIQEFKEKLSSIKDVKAECAFHRFSQM